ncbi:MAG: hypothetical protein JST64_06755 [Actinobacteria bacterium]|nr:hypothetical protein [Actinomycetota bacterium]
MAKLGLDPEAMTTLQKQLQSDAATITSLTKKLDGLLRAAWWEGTDATKFRAEWDGNHRSQLARVATALDAAANAVATNVNQQRQASGA